MQFASQIFFKVANPSSKPTKAQEYAMRKIVALVTGVAVAEDITREDLNPIEDFSIFVAWKVGSDKFGFEACMSDNRSIKCIVADITSGKPRATKYDAFGPIRERIYYHILGELARGPAASA